MTAHADLPYDTAFVLGGGGVLGASEVGALRALLEAGIHPDLVLGTSIGAVNGAIVASDPARAVEELTDVWTSLSASEVWSGSTVRRLRTLAESRIALHSLSPLREQLHRFLGQTAIEELPVRFQCCAASIECANEHWFTHGPLVEAVLASCAVPGLFPPVEIDGEHFIDGGIVNSIPVGRAVELGARTVYVLQVGRVEHPLAPPTGPFEVATVAFELARRYRFSREMAELPENVTVHLLPTGASDPPSFNVRYRNSRDARNRIDRAYDASSAYLSRVGTQG